MEGWPRYRRGCLLSQGPGSRKQVAGMELRARCHVLVAQNTENKAWLEVHTESEFQCAQMLNELRPGRPRFSVSPFFLQNLESCWVLQDVVRITSDGPCRSTPVFPFARFHRDCHRAVETAGSSPALAGMWRWTVCLSHGHVSAQFVQRRASPPHYPWDTVPELRSGMWER